MTDRDSQYDRWYAALDGKPLDLGERGDPPSGYYRFAPWKTDKEAKQTTLALWRGDEGEIFIEKNFYEPKAVSAMEADDLFTSQHVAITQDLYESRRTLLASAAWPEIHTTYLRTRDINEGVVWTEEWSRKRLSANVETHDEAGNPRAVAGNNGPPSDKAPEDALTDRIKSVGGQFAACLKEWGGEPRTKAEGDTAGNFAVKFKEMENLAVAGHKTEKEPHWAKCVEIDDKWRGPKDLAIKSRTKVLAICQAFIDKDKARQQLEVDAANAAAREAAKKEAAITGDTPAPIVEAKVEATKLGTGKTVGERVREAWKVKDYVVLTGYLVANDAIPPALAEAFGVCANNLGKALGAKVPGIEFVKVSKAA